MAKPHGMRLTSDQSNAADKRPVDAWAGGPVGRWRHDVDSVGRQRVQGNPRGPGGRTHVFHLTGVYELPLGKGKPLLSGAHGIVQTLVGGWQAVRREHHGECRQQPFHSVGLEAGLPKR